MLGLHQARQFIFPMDDYLIYSHSWLLWKITRLLTASLRRFALVDASTSAPPSSPAPARAKVDEYILPSKRALMSGKEKDDDDYQHHKGLELVGMESTIAVDVVDDKGKVFEVHPGARMRA